MNWDGTGMIKIAGTEGIDGVAWAPKGNRIAYISYYELAVIDSDGTNKVVIDNSPGLREMAWAPDATKIAYIIGKDVFTVNVDGTGKRRIETGNSDISTYSISWSPDGQWITFEKWEEGIYIVNIDGSDLTKLAYGMHPQWSPAP